MRDIRDQCQAAGTKLFFKQWGGLRPKSNGRTLDGREWSEKPGNPATAWRPAAAPSRAPAQAVQ